MKYHLVVLMLILNMYAFPPDGTFGAIGNDFQTAHAQQQQIYDFVKGLSFRCCGITAGIYQPNITTGPYVITSPGTYVVKENLIAVINGANVIEVASNDVTLDLNGLTINGNSIAPNIVLVQPGIENVTIKNGTVTNSVPTTGIGISLPGTAINTIQNALVDDITATNCGTGISLANVSGYIVHASNVSNSVTGIRVAEATSTGTIIGTTGNNNSLVTSNTTGIAIANGAQSIVMWYDAQNNVTGFSNIQSRVTFVATQASSPNTTNYQSIVNTGSSYSYFYKCFDTTGAFTPAQTSGTGQNGITGNA